MTAGPRASAESLPLTDVTLDDDFWTPRVETNREVTISHQHDQLESNGCLRNFRRAAGDGGEFEGPMFIDSDAYKWLEAASYVLAGEDDPDLRARVEDVVDLVAAAQGDDGYLHTYFQLVEPEQKWTNLSVMHELYCAGHLIEAAVAHHRATGADGLLDVATAFADHIDDVFGPGGQTGVPGHEEVELALVKLYRVTDESRYLALARYFIDARGRDPSPLADELANIEEIGGATFEHHGHTAAEGARTHFLGGDGAYDGSYAQDHRPIREQETVAGHSVRAMYCYTGATSLLQEVEDEELWAAMRRLWENMTTKRMYVTGGIGSEHEHEGFTEDYDLPNDTAYAETCAAIGSVFWNRRLFELTGDRAYADLIERTLYNGFLSGVSLEGDRFFYVNPLETDGDHHRKEWFYVACCPPNAARLLASLERYLYARGTDGDTLYVTQFVGSEVETDLGGDAVAFTQTTDYPWTGETTITFTHDDPVDFDLRLRVPEWADDVALTVDGERVDADATDGYVSLSRTWAAGDEVSLSFALPVEVLAADPRVRSDAGRVALRRGPLVYCVEDADQSAPVQALALDADASIEVEYDPDLLGGVTRLRATGTAADLDAWEGDLYRPTGAVERDEAAVVAVPYYAWDNREPGAMTVWIPRA